MTPTVAAGAARLQERLGGALDARDGLVATPPDVPALVETLAIARDHDLRVLVRGLGLRLDWGNPVEADLVVSTLALTRLLEVAPDDMVVTAEAGMTLADLNAVLATHHQVLPLEVAYPERTTLGGLVAAAPASIARTGYGEVKDWLIGLSVATPDGTLVKGGGKVVKNVAGYDLCKLYAGSLGTLGAIATVTFRVRPSFEATALLSATFVPKELDAVLASVQTTALMPAVSAMTLAGDTLRVFLGFDGFAETVAWQVREAAGLLASGRDPVVLEGPAARQARAALATSLHEGPGATIRCSVLPADMAGFLARVREQREVSAVGLCAHGALWLRSEGPDPAAWLSEVRAIARSLGGHAILESRCGFGAEVDAYMWEPGPRALMRRLQAGLDPRGLMAPGRLRLEGAPLGTP